MTKCEECIHINICRKMDKWTPKSNDCVDYYEEPKKGKWEVIGLVADYAYCKCSECGKATRLYRDSKNEFCCIADIRNKVTTCMYCGADMREEAENE